MVKKLPPKTTNARFFASVGIYRSPKDREEKKWGKEVKKSKLNKSLTGY